MIRAISMVLAAVLLVAAAAQAQPKPITEFRGMKFGGDIKDMQHMAKSGESGDLLLYKKYADDKNFQGVPLEDIRYGFGSGKFCVVLFLAKGVTSYEKLKVYFDSTFGTARQPEKNVKNFSWDSGDVTIELNYNEAQKMSEVHYIYRPLMTRSPKK